MESFTVHMRKILKHMTPEVSNFLGAIVVVKFDQMNEKVVINLPWVTAKGFEVHVS